ncbi:MAG: hypothetical protein LKI93_03875 [Bifidobacteriaceae bacterium]|jgi:hypothetical protein|nr:hypothetical protein [Bifidobacteriaceae bacterium]MCI1914416.1 hypothetical protein [Bifidobacteriaceae bacterium]MCI1935868.1 hypothetical protein [Bifidobacteriaceae bacterium]
MKNTATVPQSLEAYRTFTWLKQHDALDDDSETYDDTKLVDCLIAAAEDTNRRDAILIYWLYPDLTQEDFVTVADGKHDAATIVQDILSLSLRNHGYDFSAKVNQRWASDLCEVIELSILGESSATSLYAMLAYMKWANGAPDALIMDYVARSVDAEGNPPPLGDIIATAVEYGIKPAYLE